MIATTKFYSIAGFIVAVLLGCVVVDVVHSVMELWREMKGGHDDIGAEDR